MDQQTTERLLALWKSGRDKYRSFFTVLNEVREEIGDAALPAWCRDELFIGLSVITATAGVLTKIDAEIVKTELATANKSERETRSAAAAAAKQIRDDEANKREIEKAETAKRIAEIERETTAKKIETKKLRDVEKHRQQERNLKSANALLDRNAAMLRKKRRKLDPRSGSGGSTANRGQSPLKTNYNSDVEEESDDDDADNVAAPDQIEDNVLYAIARVADNARAVRKILKASALDREAAQRIIAEINLMIQKWRSVLSTLEKKD